MYSGPALLHYKVVFAGLKRIGTFGATVKRESAFPSVSPLKSAYSRFARFRNVANLASARNGSR